MTAREAKHQYLLTEWAGRISERAKSGMTVREWCASNHVNERVYHYWLRRVREYAAQFLPTAKSLKLSAVLSETLEDGAREPAPMGLIPTAAASPVPDGWAICEPAPPRAETGQGITIEIGKGRITATAETDSGLLMKVCRILVTL